MAKERKPINLGSVEYVFDGKKSVKSIVLTGTFCQCTKCGGIKPLSDFGLRVDQGVLRNQAQCSSCR
jgi:hypothetical protein